MLTLATSAKTARLQYNVVHSSTKKPPSKSLSYPQIMVRAAPNFRNSTNRTPAHDTIHQTSLSTNSCGSTGSRNIPLIFMFLIVGETRAPGGNPHRHRENVQTPHWKFLPKPGLKPRSCYGVLGKKYVLLSKQYLSPVLDRRRRHCRYAVLSIPWIFLEFCLQYKDPSREKCRIKTQRE